MRHFMAMLAGVGLVLAAGSAARADLLMHWDFDNVNGSTVTNTGTLGASANGEMRGGVTVVGDATFGNVAQYDNSGGTFTYMGASGVGIQVGEVATVAAFYKGTDFDYWMDQRSPRSALIADWGGNVQIYDGAWSSTGYAASNIEDDAWHHIAVTVNGSGATSNGLAPGSAKLFVDGAPVATAGNLENWDLKTGSTTLWGARNEGKANQTSGLHHDVRIYNEVLSDSAIAALVSPPPPPPAGVLVDLDGQSGPTQTGYTSWDPAGTGTIGTLNESRPFSASIATDGTVDVTMTTAGNTYERNYSPVTGPLAGQSDLLRDAVFFNNRQSGNNYYQVQLDDLKAGDYRFTAYHVLTNTVTGDATVDILLNGADTGMDVALLNTSTPAEARSSVVDFNVANDNDPITIRYANPTQNHFGLNAFELESVVLPPPGTEFKIDINAAGSPTAAGWTGLDTTAGSINGSDVTVDGVRFEVFSADGHRNRSGPDALTRDFIYDDGEGQAVGLRIFDLPDGIWEAEVWAWDNDNTIGDLIVGITRFPGETIYTTDFTANPNAPFTFQFDSSLLPDGFGIFTRENNEPSDRARFNALQLTRVSQGDIPEPVTMLAVGLGLAGLGGYIRRRKQGTFSRRVTMKATKTLAVLLAVGVFLSLGGAARAATVFLGGNLNSSGSWDNGLPGSSNPGTIAVDGSNSSTVFNFGGGSVVDQTAGTITSNDGFNMTNGTWNLSGGGIKPRYFLSNGGSTVINASGGLVELKNVSGTQHMGVANGGRLNVSGSAMLDGTQATVAVQTGGTIDFASGWTGSWTWGTYSGTNWRDLLTTNSAMKLDGASIDGPTFDSTFLVTDGGQTLSMPGGPTPPPPPPSDAYVNTINAQNPFEYYRLGTLVGENGGTLVPNTVTINQTTPSPTLDPAGGFVGLDGNVWGNFPGNPGSTLTEEDGGWTSEAGTISLWVRQATSGGGGTRTLVFAHEAGATGAFDGGTNQALGIFVRTNGSWGMNLDNVSNDTGSLSPLGLDEWHHLAFTWDRSAGVTRAYFDGGLVKPVTGSWDAFTMHNDGRFGKEISGGSRVFAGSMDEIAIWDRPLSDAEILAQYDAAFTPAAGDIPEPVTMLAVGLGLAGLGGYIRRRRRGAFLRRITMRAAKTLAVLLAVGMFLAGAGVAAAGPITFSEVTNGLSGTLVFADVSLDGALVNASTGDQTGINAGSSGGSNWGRVDASYNANNATPGGNKGGVHSNVLEGISSAAPNLKWTVSAGSGDDASAGAGSLLANTNYNVHVHYLTHTASSQNWGGEMSTSSTFAPFDQFDNNDGVLITTVPAASNPVVDYRRFELTSPVTTDGSGNAELFIRRPTSGTHVRTIIDGVVFEELGPAVPPPPPPTPIARFDVNDGTSTATPPTQVGFAGLGGDTFNTSATSGGVTLTLTQARNDRAREGGTGGQVSGSSLPDVFRDFTHGDTFSAINAQINVHLAGLVPGQPYDLRWYHYENRSGNITHNARVYEDSVSAANLLFTATGFGSNTDPDVTGFSDFTVTAKLDGTIDLVTGSHLPGAGGSGVGDRSITYFNGLDVFDPAAQDDIPEPATMLAVGLGLSALGGYARKRRRATA